MLKKEISELINTQVNKEFYSAYLYLDMANYYTAQGLDGFANWFTVQAKEEQDHAIMFYNYLLDNNEKVVLEAIAKPDKTYSAFIEPLQESYRHEQYVTSLINGIYAAANAVNDFRTMKFLDYFVTEQGEEEKNASDLIGKMELYGDDKRSLYMLNSELAARTYTAPAAAE